MTMKVFIVSFGTNPRIVAKFQTDRLTTYNDNRAGKKSRLLNHIPSPLLRPSRQMRRRQLINDNSLKCTAS